MKDYSVSLKLVSLLADGEFHSGEQLGNSLSMSRAAVNKHIQNLKSWGLNIYTLTGKGYSLLAPIQLLNEKKILSYLNQPSLSVIPVIDSTNQYLIDRMDQLSSGDACIAEYQQEGRGRRGRKWFSPFGANLYLSMYWCLEQGSVAAMGLSLVIGIVMAEVIQSLGVSGVRVKWPNDLYLHDRKLAGILVEFKGRIGEAAQVVMGAGVNLVMRTEGTLEINQDWINLQEAGIEIDRNELVAKIINSLRKALLIFERDGLIPFILRWESLDNFMNRPVKLLIGEREVHGISRGIDKHGGLLLEQNGEIKSWFGGEISLRISN